MLVLDRGGMDLKRFWQRVDGARRKSEPMLILCPGKDVRDLPGDLRMLLHRAAMDTKITIHEDFGIVAIAPLDIIKAAEAVHQVSVPLYNLARSYCFSVQVDGGIKIHGEPWPGQ